MIRVDAIFFYLQSTFSVLDNIVCGSIKNLKLTQEIAECHLYLQLHKETPATSDVFLFSLPFREMRNTATARLCKRSDYKYRGYRQKTAQHFSSEESIYYPLKLMFEPAR